MTMNKNTKNDLEAKWHGASARVNNIDGNIYTTIVRNDALAAAGTLVLAVTTNGNPVEVVDVKIDYDDELTFGWYEDATVSSGSPVDFFRLNRNVTKSLPIASVSQDPTIDVAGTQFWPDTVLQAPGGPSSGSATGLEGVDLNIILKNNSTSYLLITNTSINTEFVQVELDIKISE